MKPESRSLLEKADRSLAAARELLRRGDADFAASRAYYAGFYAAEAFLLERGLRFSRHAGVIGAFGRHAVKEAGLPAETHRTLRDAFDYRSAADYGSDFEATPAEVDALIDRVEELLGVVRRQLELDCHAAHD